VASNILENKQLDPSPSHRTLMGSDEAVLDLRPDLKDRFIAGEGHFRLKHQSGNMQMMERMNDKKFSVL